MKCLECCWCSSAAGIDYMALRSADWAVWMVLVRIKAGKTSWGWVIVVRGEGKCPHNTKTTVEVVNVCPNAGRPAEQT